MNEQNLSYLKDQLLKTGFGEAHNAELQNNISQQPEAFQMTIKTAYDKDSTEATLHFKKGTESDMYFFNRYDLELKKENREEIIKQIFYVNKIGTISLKEGYNLLDGRAVYKTLANKEGEKYDAWVQLDFKNLKENGSHDLRIFNQNYGFDLGHELAKYPIKELTGEYSERLIRSLERGNLQSATFLKDDKEVKLFITPNVAYKTLNAFDSEMNRISLKDMYTQTIKQEQTQTQTQAQTQTPARDNTLKQTEKNKPSQKQTQRQKIKH